MRIVTGSLLLAGLLACTTAIHAQDQGKAAKRGKDDILVTGKKGDEPRHNPMPPASARFSRSVAADAGMFARCLKDDSLDLQRIVVEGHVRNRATQKALDRLIRSNAGCYPRFRKTVQTGIGHYGTCNSEFSGATQGNTNPNVRLIGTPAVPKTQPSDFASEFKICRAPYDRLAVVEEVFRTYAPHFMLTKGDTLNKETIARFRAREEVRGSDRGPMDRRFYTTIACMVQLAPEESVRLIRTNPGSADETWLRETILAKANYCVGGINDVSVDPPQFRGYLADALYHWTIAAKNVETLIPAS
ncbi:hypothetical protein [Sphingomonas soli]|uniref:hypothetical protein n=1 Tax=Sphingomonas soli TaxID=266127 RepID=UPI0008314D27|nr:hypothetical protein [Sphingomonas soli]